jgi:hypothetical protein
MRIFHHKSTWAKGTLIDGAHIGYWEFYSPVYYSNLKFPITEKVFYL